MSGQVIPSDVNMHPVPVADAKTSLDAADANGDGASCDFGSTRTNVGVFVSTTGAPTGGTVTLQVSPDGVTFVASATTVTVGASPAQAVLTGTAYRYFRASLSGLTGGTTPTVTAVLSAV